MQILLNATAAVSHRRAAFVVPVLLLHVALLWLLTHAHPERARVPKAQGTKPMLLRWSEAVTSIPPVQRPPKAAPVPGNAPIQPPRFATRSITPALPSPTSAAQPVETVGAPIPLDITPASTAATASSSPTVASLDLTLRRSASSPSLTRSRASLATQDSRGNTEGTSFGEKLADALGSDERRTEENLGDGRIRLRSGAGCVIVQESRAGQLDPMGQTTRPAARGVKPCR